MSEKRTFQTTTAAEFREIAAAALAAGRLPEMVAAIEARLERYRSTLEVHEATRDYQQIRETKRVIANLESKLEIARQLAQKKRRI
jgi:hypothetical protein